MKKARFFICTLPKNDRELNGEQTKHMNGWTSNKSFDFDKYESPVRRNCWYKKLQFYPKIYIFIKWQYMNWFACAMRRTTVVWCWCDGAISNSFLHCLLLWIRHKWTNDCAVFVQNRTMGFSFFGNNFLLYFVFFFAFHILCLSGQIM